MSKPRPKLVWVVMVPGEKWGFGFSRRRFALLFKHSVQRDRHTRNREIYKRLRVVRIVMHPAYKGGE